MYGSGLRLTECARLRVKDIELRQHVIVVRDGKGGKDRTTLLLEALVEPLSERISRIDRKLRGERAVSASLSLCRSR